MRFLFAVFLLAAAGFIARVLWMFLRNIPEVRVFFRLNEVKAREDLASQIKEVDPKKDAKNAEKIRDFTAGN